MDTFIISKISQYYSITKNLELSKQIKNKMIARILISHCYKTTGYVCYVTDNQLRTVSIPSIKEKTNFPKLDYGSMQSKGIKNNMFYYHSNQKKMHAFQLLPYKYEEIPFDETIDEIQFIEVNPKQFWVIINHTHIYLFDSLKRKKKVPLQSGFFFEECLFDNCLFSDFFGSEIIAQNLDTNDLFKINFGGNSTYYDILCKDLVVIDFSFNADILAGVLPNNDLKAEDKKNCLFKFHLVKKVPNTIQLEFMSFLPPELKIIKFCTKNGLYYSRLEEQEMLSLWRRDQEIKRVSIPNMKAAICIDQLDDQRMYIEYDKSVIILDFISGSIIANIDMTTRIENLKFLGVIQKGGEYVTIVIMRDQEELGGWRQYVLDQSFTPIYEITDDSFYFYHE